MDQYKLIELEMLVSVYDADSLKSYEEELSEYLDIQRRNEDLNIMSDDEKPDEPTPKVEYVKTLFNLTDSVILQSFSNWDKERNCEAVVINYYSQLRNRTYESMVKIQYEDWKELLSKHNVNVITCNTSDGE